MSMVILDGASYAGSPHLSEEARRIAAQPLSHPSIRFYSYVLIHIRYDII